MNGAEIIEEIAEMQSFRDTEWAATLKSVAHGMRVERFMVMSLVDVLTEKDEQISGIIGTFQQYMLDGDLGKLVKRMIELEKSGADTARKLEDMKKKATEMIEQAIEENKKGFDTGE